MNTQFLCHLTPIVIVNLNIGSDGRVARIGPPTPARARRLADASVDPIESTSREDDGE
jgi:hypothetical protein